MQYLKFLLKSSNAHGIHSPFVYDLVTKCFYNSKKQKLSSILLPKGFKRKHLEVLNDMLGYFNIQKACYFVEEKHFIHALPNAQLIDLKSSFSKDLVYVSNVNFKLETIDEAFEILNKKGILIIEHPYKNSSRWEKVKSNVKAQVIVDTYFFGIIFPREIQAKEAFCIRL